MKVFGVVGWKNSGKTGLVERLVQEITGRGYTVSTIKHAHHAADIDRPGRDSHRHRMAGATEVALSSSTRFAIMHELRGAPEPGLGDLLARLSPVDLVLVEGFKGEQHPKIEARRAEVTEDPLAPGDPTIAAVASDRPTDLGLPVFDLDDTGAIADFIVMQTGLAKEKT